MTPLYIFACNKLMHKRNFVIFGINKLGGNRCSDSQSTAGRDGSVHDYLAGSGRVNRNSSDNRCVGIRLL